MSTYLALKHILVGWGRSLGFLKTPISIEELSKKRLAKCKNCPASKTSKILEIIKGKVNYIDTLYCTKCSCPCTEKTLVLDEKCPLNKW